VRARAEQRRELGLAQYHQGLVPDLVLLVSGEAVRRQCQKPLRRDVALGGWQLGQALQQPVDEKPALETVAPNYR